MQIHFWINNFFNLKTQDFENENLNFFLLWNSTFVKKKIYKFNHYNSANKYYKHRDFFDTVAVNDRYEPQKYSEFYFKFNFAKFGIKYEIL